MFRESKTNSNISTEYNLTKHSTFSTIETNQKRKEVSNTLPLYQEKMGKMNEIYIDKSNELKTLCSQYAALKKKLASKMSNLQQKKEKYLRVKNENFVIKTMVLKIVQNDNLEVYNNK